MNELDEHLELVHGARLRSLSPSVPSSSEVERMAAKAHRIADSGIRGTTGTWQVAVALVVAVVALGLATTLIPGNRAPIAEPAGTSGPEAAAEAGLIGDNSRHLFSGVGGIHDPKVRGTSLEAALARIGRKIPLPQSVESTVSKVLYFGAPDGSSDFELTILYSSGVELRVVTGEDDLDSLARRMASLQYRDGKNHVSRQLVGTRDVLLIAGGVQAGGRVDGHRAPSVAVWNEAGLGYGLMSPEEGPYDVEQLVSIVSTVR